MIKSIFIKALYDHRVSTFFWSIGVLLMVVMYITMFPSIAQSDELGEAMASMPEAFQVLFGDLSIITTPEGYLEAELFSLTLPLIVAIASIVLSGAVIYKEEASGTIELLLSRPISRSRIMLEKVAGLLVHIAIIALGVIVGFYIGKLLVEFPISDINFVVAVVQSVLLGLVFGFMSLAITALTPNRGLSVGVPAAVLILSFVVNGFAAKVDIFNAIKTFSPFHYYQTMKVLFDGPIWGDVAVLFGISAVLLIIGIIAFNRRDVGV